MKVNRAKTQLAKPLAMNAAFFAALAIAKEVAHLQWLPRSALIAGFFGSVALDVLATRGFTWRAAG